MEGAFNRGINSNGMKLWIASKQLATAAYPSRRLVVVASKAGPSAGVLQLAIPTIG
jgi:hypothetical protein